MLDDALYKADEILGTECYYHRGEREVAMSIQKGIKRVHLLIVGPILVQVCMGLELVAGSKLG